MFFGRRTRKCALPAAKTVADARQALLLMWTKLASDELKKLVPCRLLPEWKRMLHYREVSDIDYMNGLLAVVVRTSDDRAGLRRLIGLLDAARQAATEYSPDDTVWYAGRVVRG